MSACSQVDAAPAATNTSAPPTATIAPTATLTPEPTLTPTPIPYFLEDGSLFDLDEATGEYLLVTEGITKLTTDDEQGLLVVDSDGKVVIRYENGEWLAVEMVYHSGVEAIPNVEARAAEDMGMSLSEAWLRGIESAA